MTDTDRTTDDGPERPRMTIRVSRDGGRTYGPPVECRVNGASAPMYSQQYPPCECPQHRRA
ncbi:hypothetical protein AB0940_33455 [Streptomyces sp. NPDC006656]|uniref:hypothetical protein n=1 Tax=Streptomyces sp. NPDC006656 TaxID=3156899 RepID=UPI00345633D0